MEDFIDEDVELNLGSNGRVIPTKSDKVAIIDADTLVFAVCKVKEVTEVLMPREFYSKEEWDETVSSPYFDPLELTLTSIDIEEAMETIEAKIEDILDSTGCSTYELHFTSGRRSFRYKIFPEYKANRTKDITKIPPAGLKELKTILGDRENGTIWYDVEADDAVITKYVSYPGKYILCAVDKDVLYSVPGKHWNYYSSSKWNIDPKWVEVDERVAKLQKYKQTLTGDSTDGIPGLKRIGPKTADKLLKDCTSDEDMWRVVVDTYKSKGLTEDDAVTTMRLVNVHQLDKDLKTVNLWEPIK